MYTIPRFLGRWIESSDSLRCYRDRPSSGGSTSFDSRSLPEVYRYSMENKWIYLCSVLRSRTGLDLNRSDATRLDSLGSTRLDSTRFDVTRRDSTRLDSTRLNSTRLYSLKKWRALKWLYAGIFVHIPNAGTVMRWNVLYMKCRMYVVRAE
jgi:hypothetical protein